MAFTILLAATAQSFEREVTAARQGGQVSTKEILIAVTISVAVGVILFVATYLHFRKKRRNEERHRDKLPPPRPARPVEIDPETGEPARRRVRKRRRRRDHRMRNPTLDQTGGLPPPRPDDELPKF